MTSQGGCYCGTLRYEAQGKPLFKGQCHCRECQYISGGHPNVALGMPETGFRYIAGTPKVFRRSDLKKPVTREFCADCGTHILSRAPALAGAVLLKVGTLDDPRIFGMPQMAIFTIDKQPFHHIPAGLRSYERMPG